VVAWKWADDYLTKRSACGIGTRVKAMLRRVRLIRQELVAQRPVSVPNTVLTFDNLVIDLTRREVRLEEKTVANETQGIRAVVSRAQHAAGTVT